jgi:hypothetical protein
MKEYDVRKLIMKAEGLTAADKLVLLAMILKLDWETFQGRISAKEVSNLISTGERSVKRTISKLIKLGIISRQSQRIGHHQNEAALTTLHYDKINTSDNSDTSDKSDTSVNFATPPSVKDDTPPSVNFATPPSVNFATHTIDNNYNNNGQSINLLVTENRAEEEWKWGEMEREEEIEENDREINQVYTFRYPSSIVDPQERMKAENYVKANYHRLTYSDRERIMFPDLTKPV